MLEDGAVTLYCRASGHPTPDVYWRRGDRRIAANHQRYTVVTVADQVGVAVLRIEPAKPRRDDSNFECVAENGVGDPATAAARLEVYPSGQGEERSLYQLHSGPASSFGLDRGIIPYRMSVV